MSMVVGQRGFTLLELIVVVAIAGLLLTLAVPSYQQSIRNSSREEAAIALANALALARSEAIARGIPIVVAPNTAADTPPGDGLYSGGVWSISTQDGSRAFPGDASPVIETYQVSEVDSVSDGVTADISTTFVFGANGMLQQTSQATFCYQSDSTCSQLRVNLLGRSHIQQVENNP